MVPTYLCGFVGRPTPARQFTLIGTLVTGWGGGGGRSCRQNGPWSSNLLSHKKWKRRMKNGRSRWEETCKEEKVKGGAPDGSHREEKG